MADISRVEKLASARKKLKKFQKGKKSGSDTSGTKKPVEPSESEFRRSPDDLIQNHSVNDDHPQFEEKPDADFSAVNNNTHSESASDASNHLSNSIEVSSNNNSSSQQFPLFSQFNIPDENKNGLENNFGSTLSQNKLEESPSKDIFQSSVSPSTESLRQISLQLNGLMSEGEQFLNGDINIQNDNNEQLELRNQELALSLQQHEQLSQQLKSENQQLKSRNQSLQTQISKEREQFEEQSVKEQGLLKEQLQVHIQTIGILVAEKTELQSALSQTQRTAKQKTGEVGELDGRLKASRQRLTDLDKELNTLRSSKEQSENNCKTYSKEVDKLKLEIYKLNKGNDELQNQSSELVQKLQSKTEECKNAETNLSETSKKLSLSQLRVQQLSSNNSNDIQHQLEEVHEKNIELEAKVYQYKESFQKLSEERDSLTDQYQQYIQQLNQQLTSVRDELSSMTDECKRLGQEKESLQAKFDITDNTSADTANAEELNKSIVEISKLNNIVEMLEEKNDKLQQQLESQIRDNGQMSQIIEEKELKLMDQENTLSRFQEEEVDKEKLLDTIQSDKVAASRAMAQNKQLKKQLEELQEGFVQMSNDKLELTERVMSEQHNSKELQEQLQQQEHQLSTLRKSLEDKDKELAKLSQECYEKEQINDRIQHYEAQGHLSEMLQKELTDAQERINALMSQNTELRSMLTQQAQVLLNNNKGEAEGDQETKKDDLVASLSASVQQLELERDQLLRQLEGQKHNHRNLQDTLKELDKKSLDTANSNGVVGTNEENTVLKDTLIKLEDRFKKTMSQIAELTDQKQQLEHVVMQLQGETETIGDYIALYQVQRGLMKKWAAEKDEYISQLSRDREELKSKLTQLQLLVENLINKKQLESDRVSETLSQTSRSVSPDKNFRINDLSVATNPDGEIQAGQKDWDNVSTISSDLIPTTITQYYPIEHQAKRIMDLISDIGNSTLGDKPVLDTFHPCAVCSGRLITV